MRFSSPRSYAPWRSFRHGKPHWAAHAAAHAGVLLPVRITPFVDPANLIVLLLRLRMYVHAAVDTSQTSCSPPATDAAVTTTGGASVRPRPPWAKGCPSRSCRVRTPPPPPTHAHILPFSLVWSSWRNQKTRGFVHRNILSPVANLFYTQRIVYSVHIYACPSLCDRHPEPAAAALPDEPAARQQRGPQPLPGATTDDAPTWWSRRIWPPGSHGLVACFLDFYRHRLLRCGSLLVRLSLDLITCPL